MEEVATTTQDQTYRNGTAFTREWKADSGYPAWVGALAFIAFLFVLACIGGIFAELVSLFIELVGGLIQ